MSPTFFIDGLNMVPLNSPTSSNTICGLYGSPHEPLCPSTRTYKRQLMERTISDLLVKLDYTGMKYSESKKKCRILQDLLYTKNEEIESLTNEVYCLKKQKQDIWADYQDLFNRYQGPSEYSNNHKNS